MNRVPITSPLAVLTTQTTQEHIVATHSTTDLKPGDIVLHPEKGHGIVRRLFARYDVGVMYADLDRDGIDSFDLDLAGWERVETVRPGHVQVRVDDLDLSRWEGVAEKGWYNATRVAIRAANAIAAQRAESTPPADEKPMSATVTLYCPDCGEAENVTVVMLGRQSNGERWFDLREFHAHTCPPAQPDEPTEFGARIVVARPDGVREKWLRQVDGWWVNEDGGGAMWRHLLGRGPVTIGWDDSEQP